MSASTTRRRGNRTRRTKPQSPLAHVPWRPIQNMMEPLKRLDAPAEEKIHDASMRILEEIGIAYMDAEALDIWEQAGAKVDRATEMVWADRGLILELVAQAPREFVWQAQNRERDLVIGGNHVNFCAQGGVVFVNDLDRGRRPGEMEDYLNFLKIIQMCNAINIVSEQLIVPHDVPVSARHLRRSLETLRLTDKVWMEACHGRIISRDNVEMAKIAFGEQILEDDAPVVLGGIINSSSPLRYDDRMIGGMIEYAKAKQMLVITPFILAGAMAPITMAAAVAQQNAEALSGIAFTQLVRPGAPVIYGGFATNIDMQSGAPAFGTPEGAWATITGGQLARRYGVPYRNSGSLNTSNVPDAQSVFETMWATWPAVMSHANFIHHAFGWLEGGLTVSYEKMMIDLESLGMFQHFFQEVEVSDETLALDMIAQVGAGGHHLGTPHTQARFRSEYYRPILADRQNFETWRQSGVGDAAARANTLWKQVLKTYEAPKVDGNMLQALEGFVVQREKELEGVELYS